MELDREFNVVRWLESYHGWSNGRLDDTRLRPALHFALMWNLFEANACEKDANPQSIKDSVTLLAEVRCIEIAQYDQFLQFFRKQCQDRCMGVDDFVENYLGVAKAEDKKMVARSQYSQ